MNLLNCFKNFILTRTSDLVNMISNASKRPGIGSISVLVETQGKKVLFGQDLHGPFNKSFLSDLKDYQMSMQKLLDLEADVLCEGHFGVFQPNHQVRQYIETHKRQNQP